MISAFGVEHGEISKAKSPKNPLTVYDIKVKGKFKNRVAGAALLGMAGYGGYKLYKVNRLINKSFEDNKLVTGKVRLLRRKAKVIAPKIPDISKGLPSAVRSGKATGEYAKARLAAKEYGRTRGPKYGMPIYGGRTRTVPHDHLSAEHRRALHRHYRIGYTLEGLIPYANPRYASRAKRLRKKEIHPAAARKSIDGYKNVGVPLRTERGKLEKPAWGPIGKSWQTKDGKNPKGGLNEKGRKSYERENPGSNLKAPVKAGNNPRRASFLARMGNMPGPERKPNGEPTRLLLSLQAWGASSKADAKRKAAAISNRNQVLKRLISKAEQYDPVKHKRLRPGYHLLVEGGGKPKMVLSSSEMKDYRLNRTVSSYEKKVRRKLNSDEKMLLQHESNHGIWEPYHHTNRRREYQIVNGGKYFVTDADRIKRIKTLNSGNFTVNDYLKRAEDYDKEWSKAPKKAIKQQKSSNRSLPTKYAKAPSGTYKAVENDVSKSSQTAAVKWARKAKEMERLNAPKKLVQQMRVGDNSGLIKPSHWLQGARGGRSTTQAQKPLNPDRLDNRKLPGYVLVDGKARRVSHSEGNHIYIFTPSGVHGIPRSRVTFPKRPKQP